MQMNGLFIDSSKYSLKIILLHIGNEKPSISIDHAVNIKETTAVRNLSHYKRKLWPDRECYSPDKENVKNVPLINPKKFSFPPLHIKFGLMKNFVKALDINNAVFKYLMTAFPQISYGKIKESIFVDPQIRKLLYDKKSEIKKAPTKKKIIQELLKNYHEIDVHMSLKIHFLHSHFDFFPDNLSDLMTLEKRYQGYLDENMLGDYCCTLIRETDRKS
ncbi:hypothetical protein ACFW04_014682 [Cataglyphis niger]